MWVNFAFEIINSDVFMHFIIYLENGEAEFGAVRKTTKKPSLWFA